MSALLKRLKRPGTYRSRALLLLSLVLIVAAMRLGAQAQESLSEQSRERILAAYRALPPAEIEKQKVAALPTGLQFVKIDASAKIRSASFGHTTTLLVPTGLPGKPADPNKATEFYVEYGRSTNTPAATYGPFKLR